jgi:hypothetical protein
VVWGAYVGAVMEAGPLPRIEDIYLLRIQQTRSDDDIRLLRQALKALLRKLGWRALSVVEEEPQQ